MKIDKITKVKKSQIHQASKSTTNFHGNTINSFSHNIDSKKDLKHKN